MHEELGVDEFRPYLKGELLLDTEKVFYGPKITRMGLLGLLKFGAWKSMWRSYHKGFHGNLKGDGTILGSTLVIGPVDQGILFEYRSAEFGDHADPEDVLAAAKQICI
eukprot:Em0005g1200a